VIKTKVGYTGGKKEFPTYHSLGDHTETLQLEYDPNQTTYQALLDIFWKNHNPCVKNRAQYMSAIFYHDNEQKELAEQSKEALQKSNVRQIQTVIREAQTFYNAEDYHQKYLLRRHRNIFNSLNLSDNHVITSHVASRLNGYLNGHGSLDNLQNEMKDWNLNEHQDKAILTAAKSQNLDGGSCRM